MIENRGVNSYIQGEVGQPSKSNALMWYANTRCSLIGGYRTAKQTRC